MDAFTSAGKKVVVALFLACMVISILSPATPTEAAGGGFRSETSITWDTSRTVADSYLVGKEDTLVIAAGVTIYFSEGSALYVNGGLKVEGTESDPVIMTWEETGKPWSGVILNSSSVVSSIYHCRVDGAEVGIDVFGKAALEHTTINNFYDTGVSVRPGGELTWTGGEVSNSPDHRGFYIEGTAVISNATITNCDVGLDMTGGSLELDRCQIRDNQWGVSIWSGTPDIRGNIISGNERQGIVISGKGSSPDVNNNIIQSNGEAGMYITNGSSAVLSGNNISLHGDGSSGIFMDGGSTADIVSNNISQNHAGIWLKQAGKVTVSYNTLFANTGPGIHCNNTDLHIESNTFEGNGGNSIEMDGELSQVVIENNQIHRSGKNGTYLSEGRVISVTGNTITESGWYPVVLLRIRSGTVDGSTNIFRDNREDRIVIVEPDEENDPPSGGSDGTDMKVNIALIIIALLVVLLFILFTMRKKVTD